MPPSQVSIPTGNRASAPVNTVPARPSTQAFTRETLDEFQEMLVKDSKAQVLTPSERSRLKMILEDGYEVPRRDQLGEEKSKKEWGVENTKLWRAKQR